MAGKLKNISTTANYSVSFDGNGDYLTLPSGNASLQPVSSDFTIEAWVYPVAFVANGNPVAVIDANASWYAAIRFGYESAGAISLLMSTNGTTWNINLGSGLGTLTLNTWQHMAVSKSGTSVRVFLNGVQQGSTQTLSSATLMTGTNNWIGYLNAPSTQYVNGYISNWRLTKTALYTANFTPSTTPLTAIANTSLLTCQSPTIIDNSPNNFAITKNGDCDVKELNPFIQSLTISGRFSKNDILYAIQDNNWKGYTSIDVDVLCVGGGGGAGGKDGSPGAAGGSGATILGRINVPTSKTLTVTVGGGGGSPSGSASPGDPGGIGGLPGGGNGGAAGGSGASGGGGGGGGWSGIYDTSYSVYFNGSSRLTTSGSTAYTFGTGDFTVEYWAYFTSIPATYNHVVGTATTSNGFGFGLSGTATLYITHFTNGWASTGATIATNRWYHIAFARQSGTLRMFVNGVLDYTVAGLTTDITETGGTIGAINSGSYPMTGYISNLRVNKGTALYTSSFSGSLPSAPLTAISGTSILTCQSSTIIDNGPSALSLTSTGTPVVTTNAGSASNYSNAEPFVRYFIAGGGAGGGGGNEGIQNDVFAAGGGIQFNGANGTALTGGNGTNYSGDGGGSGGGGGGFYGGAGQSIPTGLSSGGGNYINPSYTINSYFSNFFDGNDYLSFPVSANYDLPADFTIEAWVHATGARTTSDAIASRWVSGNRIWLLTYDNVNKWSFAVNNSSLITYNSTIAYNTWYHIAVTRSGTTVTMWLNGVSVGTATSSYNFTSATQPLFIGRNGDSTDGSQDWLGYISNFRIVKGTALYTSNFTPPTAPLTAISGTQVLTCKSSTIIDKSTNNFTITKNGDVIVREIHPFATPPTINAELGGGIGLATGSVSMPANVNFFGYISAGSGGTFGRGINNGANGTVVIKYTGYQKATGGNVVYDNGYTFHTYNSPGTFALQ